MSMRIDSAEAMEELGRRLAAVAPPGSCIHLRGDLGAGKTTLARGFLRGCGYTGNVKSPTYTIVEPYLINNKRVYHFDLYRIDDPEELDAIGLRDYLDGESRCLVEWPERAAGHLPGPDLLIAIHMEGESRRLEPQASTETGRHWLAALADIQVPG